MMLEAWNPKKTLQILSGLVAYLITNLATKPKIW